MAFIEELTEKLFDAEKRRLEANLVELNRRNKELKGSKLDGFIYGGVYYQPSSGTLTIAGPHEAKPTLHYHLTDQMESWLKDKKIIADDHKLIRQTLFKLLKPCRSNSEIRDALPECLVSLVPQLRSYNRNMPAGYTLQGDERAMRQFDKFLPRIEIYSATRMLY